MLVDTLIIRLVLELSLTMNDQIFYDPYNDAFIVMNYLHYKDLLKDHSERTYQVEYAVRINEGNQINFVWCSKEHLKKCEHIGEL